jgi:hypothetical protein
MSDPEQQDNNNNDNENPPTASVMIIGDSLKCAHGLDTLDINEWNEHCSDPANGHTESGQTRCIDCDALIEFEGLPYHPITPSGKNISLRCNECTEEFVQQSQNVTANIRKLDEGGNNQNA